MPEYNPDAAKEAAEKAQDTLSSDGQGGGDGVDLGGANLVDLGKKAAKKIGKNSGEEAAEEGAEEAGKEAGKDATKEGAEEAGKSTAKEGAEDIGKTVAKEGAEEAGKEIGKEAAKEAAKEGAEEAGKTATGAAAGMAPGMGTLTTAGMEGADAANKAAQDAKNSGGMGNREQGSYAGDRAEDAAQAAINIGEAAISDVAGIAADTVGAGPVVEPVVRTGLKMGEKATFGAGEAMGVSKKWQITMFLIACFSPLLIGMIFAPVALGLTSFLITSSPTEGTSSTTTPGGSSPGGTPGATGPVIYYSQNDPRWNFIPYGRCGTIGSSGCGVTSLAMVISHFTGDSVLPPETTQISVSNGWRICGSGTSWAAMTQMPKMFGLNSQEIGSSWSTTKQYLDNGYIVIQSHAPGCFTKGGHFIVVTGYSGSTVYVNDPNIRHIDYQNGVSDSCMSSAKNGWAISL